MALRSKDGLLSVVRPSISFFQGVWSLKDEEAGYYRELTPDELEGLLADAYEHIGLCLRVASVLPPKPPGDGW